MCHTCCIVEAKRGRETFETNGRRKERGKSGGEEDTSFAFHFTSG